MALGGPLLHQSLRSINKDTAGFVLSKLSREPMSFVNEWPPAGKGGF